MKPTFPNIERVTSRNHRPSFPVTDFNYYADALSQTHGHCVRPAGCSFHHISREYFGTEANHYFLAETAIFSAILLTAAVPLVNGAQAVLHLARLVGGL